MGQRNYCRMWRKSKVLTSQDLVSYDTSTYETVSVAEQKLTGQ